MINISCLSIFNSVRLSHSHLSVICLLKNKETNYTPPNQLVNSFLRETKTSFSQSNRAIISSSSRCCRSSEEPNYTPSSPHRQHLPPQKSNTISHQYIFKRNFVTKILSPLDFLTSFFESHLPYSVMKLYFLLLFYFYLRRRLFSL